MKKSYLKYLVFFIAIFCFGLINVNAEQTLCRYGLGQGEKWQKKVTILLDAKIPDEVPIYLGDNESPLFTNSTSNGGFEVDLSDCDKKGNCGIMPSKKTGNAAQYVAEVNNSPCDKEIFVFLPNKYKTCPDSIGIAYLRLGCGGGDANNIAIFTDGGLMEAMQFLGFKQDTDKRWKIGKDQDWEDYNQTLILEKNKNEDPSKYNMSGCQTYSDYKEWMKETLTKENNYSCDNNPEFDRLYTELNLMCESFRNSGVYVDSKGKAKRCMSACTNMRDDIDELCQRKEDSNIYCGSLGNGIVNWIFKIIRIIRYSLPPVMIILSVLDFIKAISEDDESKIKDATKRFFRRLIAVALLFIIPFIINFILHMFNIPGLNASNPFCAK